MKNQKPIAYEEILKKRQETNDFLKPFELWFYFYQLAHKNPELSAEIKSSKKYYERWGDIKGLKFKPWIIKHIHLFDEQYIINLINQPITSLNSNQLYLSIPKNTPLNKVHELIDIFLKPHLPKPLGKKKNITNAYYRLTDGKELKVESIKLQLEVYLLYRGLNRPPINRKFLDFVHLYYRSTKSGKIPSTLGVEGSIVNEDSVLRTIRRYIQKAKLLEKNAAKGDFPGKDYTD